jgi:hypothetical protein
MYCLSSAVLPLQSEGVLEYGELVGFGYFCDWWPRMRNEVLAFVFDRFSPPVYSRLLNIIINSLFNDLEASLITN